MEIKSIESYIESSYTDRDELFKLAFRYERPDYRKVELSKSE